MKKLFGLVAAGLLALGAMSQPAMAYDHYARYDYSGYDYYGTYGNYAPAAYNGYNYGNYNYGNYNYGNYNYYGNANYNGAYNYTGANDYRYANYGHVNPGYRAWEYGYAAPTIQWKGRSTVAVTRPIGFHLEPSASAPVYGWLDPGTRLTVLGRGEGWAKVRSKWGTVGYIPEATW